MDLEQTTPVEENTTELSTEETAEAASLEASDVENTEEVASLEGAEVEGEEAPQEQTFEPNLTYNFRKEQRTIPETFKEFIKDEETNKMVKELYEKADAMDFMKESRENARKELDGFKQQVTPVLQQVEDTKYFLEKGDVSSALKVSGFTQEQIVDEAIRLLEGQNQSGGPRQAWGNPDAIQQRELERQNQMLQSQIQEQHYSQVNGEYEQATTAHASIINAYDEKFGPESFKSMVAQYGQQQEQRGRQLTVADAVREVASNLGGLMAPAGAQQPQTTQPQAQPKTFPRVTRNSSSSTSSPVAKSLKSFDDLVNYSKNYQAAN